MEDLLKAIDIEKKTRFNKSWSKLERGTKLNRLNGFIEREKITNELDEKQYIQLQRLLTGLFEKSVFSKSSEIEYCETKTEITSIVNLQYDMSTKSYSFKQPKKLVKTSAKSKSNIDRHFSRSKGNKK